MTIGETLARIIREILRDILRTQGRAPRRGGPTRSRGTGTRRPGGRPGVREVTGRVRTSYAPRADGLPDPGEVCWAWVPYEEDPSHGKDRPVLIIGRDRGRLLALPVTSKDHDRDASAQARAGRYWMDIGSGAWDPRRRPSEVRLDRVVRLAPEGVRREGAALDRVLFDEVVAAMERHR